MSLAQAQGWPCGRLTFNIQCSLCGPRVSVTVLKQLCAPSQVPVAVSFLPGTLVIVGVLFHPFLLQLLNSFPLFLLPSPHGSPRPLMIFPWIVMLVLAPSALLPPQSPGLLLEEFLFCRVTVLMPIAEGSPLWPGPPCRTLCLLYFPSSQAVHTPCYPTSVAAS